MRGRGRIAGFVAAIVAAALTVESACARPNPWLADIAYDANALDKLDIYRPAGNYADLPFVMFIHAGGWWNGDKQYLSPEDVAFFTDRGIALVAINYRNIPAAQADGLFPPVLGPLDDAKRALQFLRYHAKAFALDPARAALWGDSAGAFDALWLGLAPDRADPRSADPVARMSTRVSAIGAVNAQTSIDPLQMRAWVGPHLRYGGQAFGLPEADFDQFLAKRNAFARYFATLSPAALVGPSSPPVALLYTYPRDDGATDPMYYVHSPAFGSGFAAIAADVHGRVTLTNSADPAARTRLMLFLATALERPDGGPIRPPQGSSGGPSHAPGAAP